MPRKPCQGCRSISFLGYMVNDGLWNSVLKHNEVYCLACFEKTILKRTLDLDEFSWCPLTVEALIMMERIGPDNAVNRALSHLGDRAKINDMHRPASNLAALQDAVVRSTLYLARSHSSGEEYVSHFLRNRSKTHEPSDSAKTQSRPGNSPQVR